MLLEAWNKLPQAKQMQLAKAYGIKWYGISPEDLSDELDVKLPSTLKVALLQVLPEEEKSQDKKEEAFKYKKVQVYEVVVNEARAFEFSIDGNETFGFGFDETSRDQAVKEVKEKIKELVDKK